MATFFTAFYLLWKSDVTLKQLGTVKACNHLFDYVNKKSNLKKKNISRLEIEKLISKVKLAQILYPRSTACLPRSLALCSFLQLNGIDATMYLGIRVDPPRLLHAWVEFEGKPITDDKHRIFEYKPFLSFPSKETTV